MQASDFTCIEQHAAPHEKSGRQKQRECSIPTEDKQPAQNDSPSHHSDAVNVPASLV